MATSDLRILHTGMTDNRGGIETFVMSNNRELLKEGIKFDFVCMYDTMAYEEEVTEYGEKVYHVARELKQPIRYYKDLLGIVGNYDVVHINTQTCANILPLIACKVKRVKKVVLHSHNSSTDTTLKRIMHKFNKHFAYKMADEYIACSRAAAEWLYPRKLVESGQVKVIHNAIDYDKMKFDGNMRSNIRKELKVQDDEVLVGNIGRQTQPKNIIFLVKAFEKALDQGFKGKLLIIGNGPEHEAIMDYVTTESLSDKVVFFDNRPDAYMFYSAIDIFGMPSVYEGLSFCAVEAQASGCKCLFSTNMSRETAILPTTQFLSIDKEEHWVNELMRFASYGMDRTEEDNREYLENAGYVLSSEALRLKEIYYEV